MLPARARSILALAATCSGLAAASAHGARLGEVRVLSARGQPLQAIIDVEDESPGDAESAVPALASPARYQMGGLAFPDALREARVTRARRGDGRWIVRVQGTRPIDDDGVVLMVVLEGDGYTSTRSYPVTVRPEVSVEQTVRGASPSVPDETRTPPAPDAPDAASTTSTSSGASSSVDAASSSQAPSVPATTAIPNVRDDASRPPPSPRPIAAPGSSDAAPATARSAAPRAGDRLSLSAGGLGRASSEIAGGGSGVQRAIAHEAAMSEARSRIAQLESIASDLRRLIVMREQAIAAISAEIARLAPRPAQPVSAPTVATPAPGAPPKSVGAAAATMLPAPTRTAPPAPADPIQDVDARLVAAALAAGGAGIAGLWWLRRRRRAADRTGGDDGPDGPGGPPPTFAPYPLIDPARRA